MDWADAKAREWLKGATAGQESDFLVFSLAALLREVAEDKSYVGVWGYLDKHKFLDMAEVRRVVEEEGARDWDYATVLSRLEKLK